MAEASYTSVRLEKVEEMLAQAGIQPDTLTANDDNTFTASFQTAQAPIIREKIRDLHPALMIIHDDEMPDARQPNVEPHLPALVNFAFVKNPD